MISPATLLHNARTGAQLSIRALAGLAGVSASTISRIEAGQIDPTVGMLSRLLDSTGLEMELTTHPIQAAARDARRRLAVLSARHRHRLDAPARLPRPSGPPPGGNAGSVQAGAAAVGF